LHFPDTDFFLPFCHQLCSNALSGGIVPGSPSLAVADVPNVHLDLAGLRNVFLLLSLLQLRIPHHCSACSLVHAYLDRLEAELSDVPGLPWRSIILLHQVQPSVPKQTRKPGLRLSKPMLATLKDAVDDGVAHSSIVGQSLGR